MAPVVHETLEILEKHVLVFVQKALDGIPATHGEADSERNEESHWPKEKHRTRKSVSDSHSSDVDRKGVSSFPVNGLKSLLQMIGGAQAGGLVGSQAV